MDGKSEPIPDDIMAKAREVVVQISNYIEGGWIDEAAAVIAAALAAERESATLAERERCAEIAKEQARVDKGYDSRTSANGIAIDILSGLSLRNIDDLGRERRCP